MRQAADRIAALMLTEPFPKTNKSQFPQVGNKEENPELDGPAVLGKMTVPGISHPKRWSLKVQLALCKNLGGGKRLGEGPQTGLFPEFCGIG